MKGLKKVYWFFVKFFFRVVYDTQATAAPVTFRIMFMQKILGFNKGAYWPVHFTSVVSSPQNIKIGIGTAPGLSPGCYIQGIGKLFIGNYTIIAPNVGIITGNHSLYDYNTHEEGVVVIGNYCWLGMNSVVLPDVEIGDHVIVAAGAIVTKSFKEGFCVLAGNPARIIKKLDKKKVIEQENKHKYYGYIPEGAYDNFRKKRLNV